MSPIIPFRVKICGVRLKRDVVAAGDSAADAIGLNFFPPSVRSLDPDQESTKELSERAVDLGLFRVGVFVNESAEHIRRVAEAVPLDAIQLHGDESVADARRIAQAGLLVIRAIKLPPTRLAVSAIDRAVGPWVDSGIWPLLDTDAGAAHGGSGRRLDWDALRSWAETRPEVHWTLAGGLGVDNISEAIRRSGACSVDVASGVESHRGEKSAGLIRTFAEAASAQLQRPTTR